MKDFIKKYKNYALAFIVPMAILLALLFYLHIFIRNESTLIISDLDAQYVALFAKFQDILMGKSSIFYSFEQGVGGNLISTIAYYLISPWNLLVVFFSKVDIPNAVTTIILIKLSLCGLTMYAFLKSHFLKKPTIFLIMFSTMYALTSYNVAYYFHVMWFDAVYLAPLVMLGLDRLIKDKKIWLYTSTLLLTFLTNFYIGYMVAIFSVIYYTYRTLLTYKISDKKNIIRSLIDFGTTSLAAGITSFVVIVPTLKQLGLTPKMTINIFELTKLDINFNIFDIFSKSYLGAHNYSLLLNYTTVLLYAGIIVIPLIILYFMNKDIGKKEKIFATIIFAIMIVSFSVNYINFMWHGFNAPLAFNARYSFLFLFFMIYISAISFFKSKSLTKVNYQVTFLIVLYTSVIMACMNYSYLNDYLIYATVGLSGLYLLLISYYNNKEYAYKKHIISKLIVGLVLVELFFNAYVSLYQYKFVDAKEASSYYTTLDEIIKSIKNGDKSIFYRIEKDLDDSQLDGLLYNYNGVNIFLSTTTNKVMNFFSSNAYTTLANSVAYMPGNPIIESTLGVKYLALRNSTSYFYDKIDSFSFSKYDGDMFDIEQTEINVYNNPNALSLGYMISDESLKFTNKFVTGKNINKVEFTNLMVQTMLNDYSSFFHKLDYKTIDRRNYEVTIADNNYLYFYFGGVFRDKKDILNFYVDDTLVDMQTYYNNNFIIIKSNYKVGDVFKITVIEQGGAITALNPAIYSFDYDKFNEMIQPLKDNQMEIEIFENEYIKGSVTATKDKSVLFTSIPNEPGWTAYVDGKKVEPINLYGAFIGLILKEGTHTIEFKFFPPGVIMGIVISLIGLAMMVAYYFLRNKIIKLVIDTYIKYEEVINYLIVGGLTTAIGIGSYVIFAKLFGINYLISSVMSWIIAVLFAYVANKFYVFKKHGSNIIKELIEFVKYRLLSLVIDVALMYMFVTLMSINDVFAKLVVQIVIIILNYFFSKLFIFK